MIIYGGVKYFKVRHAVLCKICKEIIESKSQRDYVTCKCGAVAVDGGVDGRIIGASTSFEDRSVYRSITGTWLPSEVYIPRDDTEPICNSPESNP